MRFVPGLFVEADAGIGGRAAWVLDALRGLLPRESRVLDLGCGTGTIAVALATTLGLRVHGIDAVDEFVVAARERALREGAGDRCTFERGDARDALRRGDGSWDAALWIGIGSLLGPLREIVEDLRRLVRPGGLVVVNDDVDARDAARRDAALARLRGEVARHGDSIVRELLPADADLAAAEADLQTVIRAAGDRCASRRPDLRPAIERFLERQRAAARAYGRDVGVGFWVVRRGE